MADGQGAGALLNAGRVGTVRGAARWARDRGTGFYFGASLVFLLAVAVGFHTTYTTPMLERRYDGPKWGHIHGALALAWVLLVIAQSWGATRWPHIHRKLGCTALAIIPLWCASTFAIVREGAMISLERDGLKAAEMSVLGGLLSPVIVVMLVGLALHLRRKPQWHKRLMFLATVMMLWPAWIRWRHYFANPRDWEIFFAFFVAMAPIPIAMLRDRLRFGAVHPAYWTAGSFILLEQAMEVVGFGHPLWYSASKAAYDLLV